MKKKKPKTNPLRCHKRQHGSPKGDMTSFARSNFLLLLVTFNDRRFSNFSFLSRRVKCFSIKL